MLRGRSPGLQRALVSGRFLRLPADAVAQEESRVVHSCGGSRGLADTAPPRSLLARRRAPRTSKRARLRSAYRWVKWPGHRAAFKCGKNAADPMIHRIKVR